MVVDAKRAEVEIVVFLAVFARPNRKEGVKKAMFCSRA